MKKTRTNNESIRHKVGLCTIVTTLRTRRWMANLGMISPDMGDTGRFLSLALFGRCSGLDWLGASLDGTAVCSTEPLLRRTQNIGVKTYAKELKTMGFLQHF